MKIKIIEWTGWLTRLESYNEFTRSLNIIYVQKYLEMPALTANSTLLK